MNFMNKLCTLQVWTDSEEKKQRNGQGSEKGKKEGGKERILHKQ